MYEKWCIFQDWTPFLKVKDSANREIFIGTTLVLKSYMSIIAAELYSSPSTSAWGKLGTLLPSMAAFPRWSRMPSLPQRWAIASPSSCPVCLAPCSFLAKIKERVGGGIPQKSNFPLKWSTLSKAHKVILAAPSHMIPRRNDALIHWYIWEGLKPVFIMWLHVQVQRGKSWKTPDFYQQVNSYPFIHLKW